MNWLRGCVCFALVSLGIVLVLWGYRFVRAQDQEPEPELTLKCRVLTGTVETSQIETVQGAERHNVNPNPSGQMDEESCGRNDCLWTVIDAPGLGPGNVIGLWAWYPAKPLTLFYNYWSPPPGTVSQNDVGLSVPIQPLLGGNTVYLLWKTVYYENSRQRYYDEDSHDWGPWSEWTGWHSTSETVHNAGAYTINVVFFESLSVENPGDGKSLKLDWGGIVPGQGVKGYQIWRRERPDLE